MAQFARRQILTRLAAAPFTGLSLAAVLADRGLARAAAAMLEKVTLETRGGKTVGAALALPAQTPAPAIMLIHEWWGLNDQIKAVAREFAREGYVGLAIDLYDGRSATVPEDARSLMQQVDADEATDTLVSWIGWLRGHEKVAGKVGTVGWCFGGGWSLNASIAAPVDATVVYYGRVNRSATDLETLAGPVLAHFTTRDGWITRDMVDGFEQAMTKLGKTVTSHWYEADHGFANPTSARYDREDAQLAWQRTLAFFEKHF